MKYKLLNKTTTEVEEEKYGLRAPLRISKTFALFMVTAFVSIMLFAAFEEPVIRSKLNAEDGAGTYWTCSNCGSSNKCYEMSCSNCGTCR